MTPTRRWHWPSIAAGVFVGGLAGWGVQEVRYVNWRSLAAPVDEAPLVIRQDAKGDGRFGAPRSGNRAHRGIDIVAGLGSPVRAVRSGVVVTTGMHRGLGRYVELAHGEGLHSLYAHLQAIDTEAGRRVRQGERIGTVGKTGNARHRLIAPHVHLELVKDAQPVDPATMGLEASQTAMTEPVGNADGGD
jgi:murein DD-endopeptidase MepM/ murein hydrolase activator NlpD